MSESWLALGLAALGFALMVVATVIYLRRQHLLWQHWTDQSQKEFLKLEQLLLDPSLQPTEKVQLLRAKLREARESTDPNLAYSSRALYSAFLLAEGSEGWKARLRDNRILREVGSQLHKYRAATLFGDEAATGQATSRLIRVITAGHNGVSGDRDDVDAEFLADLDTCIQALRDGDLGVARSIVNKWNREYLRTLPADAGLAAIAVRDIIAGFHDIPVTLATRDETLFSGPLAELISELRSALGRGPGRPKDLVWKTLLSRWPSLPFPERRRSEVTSGV
jgi:hypothetical protein